MTNGKDEAVVGTGLMHNLTNGILHIELSLKVCITLTSRSQRAIGRIPYPYNSTE